jgi:pimeloyl-ACP methyl ester carboxylesterase
MSVMEGIEWGRHGPRVVLVHGDIFDAPATFASMEPLAANHQLVLVNRRGFGASPAVDGEGFDVDAGDLAECWPSSPPIPWGTLGVVSLVAAAQALAAAAAPVTSARGGRQFSDHNDTIGAANMPVFCHFCGR